MKELYQMTPMEIVHAMFNEFDKINQRLDRIEKILEEGSITQGKKILTLVEAAEYLNYSKSYLYKLTSSNEIPFYKTGKRVYFKKELLDEYLTKDYRASNDDIDRMANEYLQRNPLKYK